MPRVISRTWGVGTFQGVEFREEVIDGLYVGVGNTNDPIALAWFELHGFEVEGRVPPAPTTNATPAPDLGSLTVAELRAYAAENSIDLGDATRKADILAVITGS